MTDDRTPDAPGQPDDAPGQPDPADAAPIQPDPADAAPPPISPGGPWQTGTRVEQLAPWMQVNRSRFTDAALERSAIEGGFTPDEARAALALADTRQREAEAIVPVRSTATRIVLGAYGLVWILFAIPYLIRPGPSIGAFGPIAQGILTIALLLGLLISFAIMRALHPNPAHVGRALTILLVVPVIVLLGISGLCLPFAGTSGVV
jgi:hypothetical protein